MKKIFFIFITLAILFFSSSCSSDILKKNKVYILSVALNYQNTNSSTGKLKGTINDVTELTTCLQQIYNSKGANVEVTYMIQEKTDSSFVGKCYPCKDNFINELDNIKNNVSKDDTFLFIYSGHGQTEDNGVICLTAKDPKSGEDYHELEQIKMTEIFDIIDSFPCNSIIIEDCCYSGTLTEKYPEQTNTFSDAFSNMFKKTDFKHISVLAASKNQEQSYEGSISTDYSHGYFTYMLLKCLDWDHSKGQTLITINGEERKLVGSLSKVPSRTSISEIYSQMLYLKNEIKEVPSLFSNQNPTFTFGVQDAILIP